MLFTSLSESQTLVLDLSQMTDAELLALRNYNAGRLSIRLENVSSQQPRCRIAIDAPRPIKVSRETGQRPEGLGHRSHVPRNKPPAALGGVFDDAYHQMLLIN
jgi:hypothetical protein